MHHPRLFLVSDLRAEEQALILMMLVPCAVSADRRAPAGASLLPSGFQSRGRSETLRQRPRDHCSPKDQVNRLGGLLLRHPHGGRTAMSLAQAPAPYQLPVLSRVRPRQWLGPSEPM
jgi:hypothetical protein